MINTEAFQCKQLVGYYATRSVTYDRQTRPKT